MSDYSLKAGKQVSIPLKGADQFGNSIAIPADLHATSSDNLIATVSVGADGSSIDIVSVNAGDVTISVVSGNVIASLAVTIEPAVEAPKLASITFDLTNAVVTDIPVSVPPSTPAVPPADSGASAASDPTNPPATPTDGSAPAADGAQSPSAPTS